MRTPVKPDHWPALQVWTPLLLHSVAPELHAPVQAPALHTLVHGEPVFCHVPVVSHVWGCCPLHCVAPGVHTALPQVPLVHTYGHVAPVLCKVPVLLHVCGCRPLHVAEPGEQTPVHAPDTHAWFVHVAGALQVPLELHVSTPLLTHWVVPGMQDPVQAPDTHAWFVQVAGALHVPLELHVSTPSFTHCVAPGVHIAHAPLTHTAVDPVHARAVPQLPVASHVCTPLLEHCVAPGLHTPEQHAAMPPSQPVVAHTYGQLWRLPQAPAVQVSTPLFEHCAEPVVQPVVQTPLVHVFAHGIPLFCHVPVASHVCGCWPLHCIADGVQTPVHVAVPWPPSAPASDAEPPTQTYGQVVLPPCHWPLMSHACGT